MEEEYKVDNFLLNQEKYCNNDFLNEFNRNSVIYDTKLTLIDLFKNAVTLYGNDIALRDINGSLTYLELDRKSDCIAMNILRNNLVMPEVIAINMKRSKEYIVTMLGILKAGAAYMPLDEIYPEERIRYMMENSNTTMVIVDSKEKIYTDNAIKYYPYSEISYIRNEEEKVNISSKLSSQSNAYVMYTSGSTGKPKGIIITHQNLVSLFYACQKDILDIHNQVRLNFAVIAPFVFDISQAMVYLSLFHGNVLHVTPNECKKHGQALIEYYNKYNIHISDVTPSHLRLIADYLESEPLNYLCVKHLITIGETLPLNLAKRIVKLALDKDFILTNTYGPTECTILVTKYKINKRIIEDLQNVHIGTPIGNSKIYILDDKKEICPIGVEGEIYISGDCVGKGYINNDKLTKQIFTCDIFDGSKTMYASGDIGKWTIDGDIEYIGRKDKQIKINGHRVELEEIQYRIEMYPGVKEAKVLVDKSNSLERIVAYFIVIKPIEIDQLLKYIKKHLPYYMIPSHITQIETFPYNNNGKIDERKLLTYNTKSTYSYLDQNYSHNQRQILKICANILGKSYITLNDNFFELGGSSIDLLMFSIEVNKYFKVKVFIHKLYAAKNIGEFVTYIEELKDKSINKVSVAIKSQDKTKYINVLQGQKIILDKESKLVKKGIKHTQYEGITLIYIVKVNKYINYDRLKSAVKLVIDKHGILRTTFTKEKNKYYMKEHTHSIDYIRRIDITESCPTEDYKNYLNTLEMNHLPLFEVILLEKKEQQKILINVHHAIIDFISISILLKEIFRAYEEGCLEEIDTSYFDYIQRCNMKKNINNNEFWKNAIENRDGITCIPADIEGEDYFCYEFINIPVEIQKYIELLSRTYNVSEYNILLGIFGLLVSIYTKRKDIIIGTYIPGRDYDTHSETIGMFTVAVPIRMYIDYDNTFNKCIDNLKSYLIKVFENQDITLSEIYKNMSFEEVLKGELFTILFNYESMLKNHPCYKEYRVDVNTINYNPDITDKDIYFGIVEETDNLRIELKYNKKNHSKEKMNKFIKDYFNLIKCIAERPDVKIRSILKETQ